MTGLPRLLFGVGAQKSGTSWLYAYLRRHPECGFRSIKEYHYFNTHGPAFYFARRAIARRKQREIARERPGASPQRRKELDARSRDYDAWLRLWPWDDQGYLRFVTAEAQGKTLAGDITPAYARLPARSFRRMARLAPETRFVFVMRDPLERLWSSVRMSVAKSEGRDAPQERQMAAALRLFDRSLAGRAPWITSRSDYRGTLRRLAEAVPREDLFVGFYEDLFQPEKVARLTAFLGIAPVAAETEHRVGAGLALPLDPTRRAAAAAWLAPQYEAAEALAGGRLPEAWKRNRTLGRRRPVAATR